MSRLNCAGAMIDVGEVLLWVVWGIFAGWCLMRLNALEAFTNGAAESFEHFVEDLVEKRVEEAVEDIQMTIEENMPDLDPFDMIQLQKQQLITGGMAKLVEFIGSRLNTSMGLHAIEEPTPPDEDNINPME